MKNDSKQNVKHYSLDEIKKKKATYSVIFGERSDGKTYAVLFEAYKMWLETGKQLAIIRRWDTDFQGPNSAKTCYDSLMHNGDGINVIEQESGGLYSGVEYYSGVYYLTVYDDETNKSKRTDKVIARGFSINNAEHYKSSSMPLCGMILFDEFITRKYYIQSEWVEFCNLVSTIVRSRNDIPIYMCGNSVNKYGCPYYEEMGLTHIQEMQKGDIDVYHYGDSKLTVAVEYSEGAGKQGKPSDVYFAFDNPRLKMITEGGFEMDNYPHCPMDYYGPDKLFDFFIDLGKYMLHGEVVCAPDEKSDTCVNFVFIHKKTTPIKDEGNDLIYTSDHSPLMNHEQNFLKPRTKAGRKVLSYYDNGLFYFQDNDTGEQFRTYIQRCMGAA